MDLARTFHRPLPVIATLALGVTGLLAAALPAGATGPSGATDAFGLPALARSDRYVMTPAARTVRPARVAESHKVNGDYVTADSPASEKDGHALTAGPSSTTARVDGVQVRQAGPDVAGASFGYRMRVPGTGPLTLRVEEAGSATGHYEVLVNGTVVHERKPDTAQAGVWGGPGGQQLAGLVHYDVAVPARLAGSSGSIQVTFRNAAEPGPGARVHAVWTLADAGRTTAPYGGTVTDPGGAARGGTTTLRSDAYGRPYVVYDFGQEVGGKIGFTAHTKGGAAPKIGLAFSESPTYLTTASDYSQDPVGLATETHYLTPGAGRSAVTDPVIRGGFRYLMVFLAEPGEVELSGLKLDFTADPANPAPNRYRGAFLSSDETFNRLWYSGAYTVQMSTIDPRTGRPYPGKEGPVGNDATVGDGDSVITDGGKRDRMIWGGDNAVADVVSYLSTGRPGPAANAVGFMAKGQAASGQIPGLYLTESQGYNLGWGEYAEWWVQNFWDHYLYTGDRAFLDRWYGAMKKNMAWLESKADADGVLDLKGAGGTWGYGNEGKGTYTSSLYVRVLGLAARAAEAKGEPDAAKTYREQAARTAAGVNATLWDPAAGAYKVGPGDAAHPQDGNAMAVVAGVATGDRARSVLRFFDTALAGRHGDLTVDKPGGVVPQYISPFVSNSALLAQVKQGDADGAGSLLKRTWAPMLGGSNPGTLWENVNPDGAPRLGSYTSMAHGWAAGPTSFLTNQVLGVTPTSGGFSTFTVLPHPTPGLRWAQGRVPTPAGNVTASWKRQGGTFSLQVVAPGTTSATAGVPADGVREVRLGRTPVWRSGHALRPGVVVRDGLIQVPGLTGTSTLTAR
ncbi:alpha-L-rhamnosidase-related protein [Spirillospora sp. NBC_01491]|uniref:alpha-L-rhamnosidase-related protein n=1 Tax=Spirillospora sp. NBC_01491 TaxID=2976007 RepID=UPI002E35274C|nr:alpha-L-rhamnosidase C-terminal domain-containing protein [Spirillospora sp. NBC_01491]